MDVGSYFSLFAALLAGEYAIQPEDVFGIIFQKNLAEQYVRFDSEKFPMNFKTNDNIFFIIHGWMESRNVQWYQDLTEALLNQSSDNIIIQVDWSKGSQLPRPSALKNNEPTGEIIGKFIYHLMKFYNLNHAQTHLIGFSMGGQVSGFTGKKILSLSGKPIGRITALDPSGMGYNNKPEEERLNSKDAELVAVLHTDAMKIGFRDPTGDVDLYANSKHFPQPGCPDKIDPVELVYCSHFRAYMYFIEATKYGNLIGTKCQSFENYKDGLCKGNEKLNFTGDISKGQEGVYYVETRSEPPFLQ